MPNKETPPPSRKSTPVLYAALGYFALCSLLVFLLFVGTLITVKDSLWSAVPVYHWIDGIRNLGIGLALVATSLGWHAILLLALRLKKPYRPIPLWLKLEAMMGVLVNVGVSSVLLPDFYNGSLTQASPIVIGILLTSICLSPTATILLLLYKIKHNSQ